MTLISHTPNPSVTVIGDWSPCPYLNPWAFFILCFLPLFSWGWGVRESCSAAHQYETTHISLMTSHGEFLSQWCIHFPCCWAWKAQQTIKISTNNHTFLICFLPLIRKCLFFPLENAWLSVFCLQNLSEARFIFYLMMTLSPDCCVQKGLC